MNAFQYEAVERGGSTIKGVIEAEDRRAALRLLGEQGLFPSRLESSGTSANGTTTATAPTVTPGQRSSFSFGSGIKRKEITAFTREMGALLGAGIAIPQALDGLGTEEENPALQAVLLQVAEEVRKGVAFSAALDQHPRHFNKLYVSMIRVGEEAGALPAVLNDLCQLLEHEDEVRSEVAGAVAYPAFVVGFGLVTVIILLTVVLPSLFGMLQEMIKTLPLPTLILLRVSGFMHLYWPYVLVGAIAAGAGLGWVIKSPRGAEAWDRLKLRLPLLGPVFMAAALSRFARTLGTLAKSGVSLLPALKIVENTIGNIALAKLIAQVGEETRGGDSLAAPLRKLGIFPKTFVQMINVGEESGRLADMLLKVAEMEERHMRAKTKTLVSLLGPILIVVVGAVVGFMVIALLLPIFKMSRGMH